MSRLEATNEDEQLLKEISKEMKFHIFNPKVHNVDMTKEIIIVEPDKRITSQIMTRAEYCEVLSNRAKHIENSKNNLVFVDIENEIDPIEMAKKEIKHKKCPLSIVRMYGYGSNIGEIWEVNEMTIPF